MIFLSKTGQHRVVLRSEEIEYIAVQGTDKAKKVRIPGITVTFQEMAGQGPRGGMVPGLSSDKRGYRGIYETKDVEEIKMMVGHRGFGTSFVGISDDGSELDVHRTRRRA